MALKLNSQDVTVNKLNSVDVTFEYLNGSIVYQSGATVWTAISNPGSYNGTYNYSYDAMACRTQTTVRTNLTSARPPGDYSPGYIMRVTHGWIDWNQNPPAVIPCTVYYFRAD